jgi:cell wall-associated NlpC family hydrolase
MKSKYLFFPALVLAILISGCSSARFSSSHHQERFSNDEKDLRKALVVEALRYRGIRYVYGGTTPNGFDCSGFVQYIYAKFGIQLPRTVKAMEGCGAWVTRGDLVAGDLVIFRNPRHVGIYASKGTFVHASSSRGVVRDKLDQEYYRKRFVGGKNIVSGLLF